MFLLNSTISLHLPLIQATLSSRKNIYEHASLPQALHIRQISPYVCIQLELGETDAHDKADNGKKADLYMAPERREMKM